MRETNRKLMKLFCLLGWKCSFAVNYTSLPYSLWEWFLALKLHVVLYNHKIIYYYYSRLFKSQISKVVGDIHCWCPSMY